MTSEQSHPSRAETTAMPLEQALRVRNSKFELQGNISQTDYGHVVVERCRAFDKHFYDGQITEMKSRGSGADELQRQLSFSERGWSRILDTDRRPQSLFKIHYDLNEQYQVLEEFSDYRGNRVYLVAGKRDDGSLYDSFYFLTVKRESPQRLKQIAEEDARFHEEMERCRSILSGKK